MKKLQTFEWDGAELHKGEIVWVNLNAIICIKKADLPSKIELYILKLTSGEEFYIDEDGLKGLAE